MNSLFAKAFTALQAYIATEVPEIKHIDMELGQLENYAPGTRPAVSLPCLLIDFIGFNFKDDANNGQMAEGDMKLRLGFPPYSSSSHITPTTYKEKALAYLEIEWKLHKALQGWTPGEEFGMLNRRIADTERREDDIRVRVIAYGLAFEDVSTHPNYIMAPAEIKVGYEGDGQP